MNWKKIVEQVVTIVLAMVITAVGTAIAMGLTMLFQHDRELGRKDSRIEILEGKLAAVEERDREIVTILAEELKKLQEAMEETCEHVAHEKKPEEKTGWFTIPKTKTKVTEKFFPDKENYERILRDKFEQRTQQLEQRTAP